MAAGHNAIPPQSEKPPAYPVDRDHQLNAPKGNDAGGLKLRSGYALPAFQASGILILIDAPLSASLSRCSEVSFGSIASLWPSVDYFRSSPGSGHRHGRSS